jgi:hypothetical protein
MRRTIIRLGLGIGMLLGSALAAPAAFAGGNGAITITQNFHDDTMSNPDVNPCSGATGTTTMTFNGVIHGTFNANGSWVTGTMTGAFQFVPDDPSQPTYTGHFTSWFGDENNRQNGVEHFTFTVHVTGTDGSRLTFHETFHDSVSASGMTVTFDKAQLTCG